jgi:hypothetical protein
MSMLAPLDEHVRPEVVERSPASVARIERQRNPGLAGRTPSLFEIGGLRCGNPPLRAANGVRCTH